MEFFIILYSVVTTLILPTRELNGQQVAAIGLPPMPVYAGYIIAGVLFFVIYFIRGLGLFTMARRSGNKQLAIFAFIPFLSTLLIGQLCGDSKLRGMSMKIVALITMILEILYATSLALYTISLNIAITNGWVEISATGVSLTNAVFDKVCVITNILNSYVFSFLVGFASVALLVVFFQRYSPSNALLIVLLNLFLPVAWIFIFTCRNAKPITQEELRRKMAQANAQFNANAPNGMPNANVRPPVDPFGEYSDKKEQSPFDDTKMDDPFEFDDKNPKDPFDGF